MGSILESSIYGSYHFSRFVDVSWWVSKSSIPEAFLCPAASALDVPSSKGNKVLLPKRGGHVGAQIMQDPKDRVCITLTHGLPQHAGGRTRRANAGFK